MRCWYLTVPSNICMSLYCTQSTKNAGIFKEILKLVVGVFGKPSQQLKFYLCIIFMPGRWCNWQYSFLLKYCHQSLRKFYDCLQFCAQYVLHVTGLSTFQCIFHNIQVPCLSRDTFKNSFIKSLHRYTQLQTDILCFLIYH